MVLAGAIPAPLLPPHVTGWHKGCAIIHWCIGHKHAPCSQHLACLLLPMIFEARLHNEQSGWGDTAC